MCDGEREFGKRRTQTKIKSICLTPYATAAYKSETFVVL